MIQSICVYCGSSDKVSDIYKQQARYLGEQMAARNINLVYGGGNLGLMGILANSALDNRCKVTGIIPKALHEIGGKQIGETIVVDTMHERKQLMSDKADAFIALPGGFGTLEELIEATTWSQLRIHSKPIGVLNVNGFYNHIEQWINSANIEGFIDDKSRRLLVFADNVTDLLNKLEQFEDPIANGDWILNQESWKKKHLHKEDI